MLNADCISLQHQRSPDAPVLAVPSKWLLAESRDMVTSAGWFFFFLFPAGKNSPLLLVQDAILLQLTWSTYCYNGSLLFS